MSAEEEVNAIAEGSSEPGSGKNSARNKQKKRKKKFLANVKGFGKRGQYGHGAHLEGDEWSYFINILDVIKKGFDSLDDKGTQSPNSTLKPRLILFDFVVNMANNVLEQTVDKEVRTSSNQVACTIVETLLPFTSAENFERFQTKFAEGFRPICSDKFASHILQKLVSLSMLRAVGSAGNTDAESSEPQAKKRKTVSLVPSEREYNSSTEFSEEHKAKCAEFVVKVSKFLLNNLEDFVWDTYGNHVMRTCFDSLTGIYQVKKSFITNEAAEKASPNDKRYDVPEEWIEVLREYANRLQAWPQFPDFPYNELSSGLMQSLCVALYTRDKSILKSLGKRLLKDAFAPKATESADGESKDEVKHEVKDEEMETKEAAEDEENGEEVDKDLPSVFTSESSARCLEALIEVAGQKLFTQIYLQLFFGRLPKLALLRLSNFSVQKLLDHVSVKEDFEAIFDELEASIEDLLQVGHTGVVSGIGQACLRLSAKQGPFMKAIQTALDCLQPKEKADKFALLTLKLKPYSVAIADKSNFVHIHGAVILQTMLKFNKPIKLVQSILDMKNSELVEIFCSPKGSHVVDAFMESQFVGEKSREKLIRHMSGCYLDLAISKNGSWAVEKFFNATVGSLKSNIVKELAEKQNQLNSTPSGRFLNTKFCVDKYRLSAEQWKAAMNKGSKAEKLFKEIL